MWISLNTSKQVSIKFGHGSTQWKLLNEFNSGSHRSSITSTSSEAHTSSKKAHLTKTWYIIAQSTHPCLNNIYNLYLNHSVRLPSGSVQFGLRSVISFASVGSYRPVGLRAGRRVYEVTSQNLLAVPSTHCRSRMENERVPYL